MDQVPVNLRESIHSDSEAATKRFIRARLEACRDVQDGRMLWSSLGIPFLKLDLPSLDHRSMLSEALALESEFVAHRSSNSRGWKSLCLHGIDSRKTLGFDQYGYANEDDVPYSWTEVSAKSPMTTTWLKSLLENEYYVKMFRVRYMWLEPQGYIEFHRDRPPEKKSLGPLNIALNMPAGCEWIFREWGKVPFEAGSTIAVDISNEHAVWNLSSEPRVHIIIHGRYGPAYYEAIARAATSTY